MRSRRSDKEWAALVEECTSSGLSGVEFCKTRGIPVQNFYRAKSRLGLSVDSGSETIDADVVEAPIEEMEEEIAVGSSPNIRITSAAGHALNRERSCV